MVAANRESRHPCIDIDSTLNPSSRFLWRYINGKLDVFNWTGKNDYVAMCEPGYLSFGGGQVFLISSHFHTLD